MNSRISMIFLLIFLGVFLNAAAQLLLKAGFYVLSVVVWLLVLSRVQVSYAYPMLSVGYVVNALAAFYFFGEDLSLLRMTGIFIIMSGVYLVARS
jgi:multidrug transporter EmrE-like cation transporter